MIYFSDIATTDEGSHFPYPYASNSSKVRSRFDFHVDLSVQAITSLCTKSYNVDDALLARDLGLFSVIRSLQVLLEVVSVDDFVDWVSEKSSFEESQSVVSPLHACCSAGNCELIHQLISVFELQDSLHVVDPRGRTPLFWYVIFPCLIRLFGYHNKLKLFD